MSVVKFYSTKDIAKQSVSFEQALLRGLAPDGGLYIPDHIPHLDLKQIQEVSSIADLGLRVFETWLGDSVPELGAIIASALNFPAPLRQLGDDLWVLELFHGPTLSFKDFGARTMARLMQHYLALKGEKRIILVATSGDTGSAVADGFAGQDAIEVILLYPKNKVSAVQERQLIVKRPGVKALAVEGSFDDAQHMVKTAFLDPELTHIPLSSANSINIGRLLPQALYYLWAVKMLMEKFDGPLTFCVPSGNLGNLTAGLLASLIQGVDHQFIAAHNANNFFPEFLQEQQEAFAFKKTIATHSNAMDVGAPSNFERLHSLFPESVLRKRIWGTSVNNQETLKSMKSIFDSYAYLSCPHTAVGLEAIKRYREHTPSYPYPFVSLACAHPAKFPKVSKAALGFEPPKEPALERLFSKETQVETIPAKPAALKEVLLQMT